jgi:hypothetical protein
MCREEGHKGHITQPLKCFIESLKQQYENDLKDYSREFQGLEESKSMFLMRLRETVERVAEEFQRLEQEAIERFEELRTQMMEKVPVTHSAVPHEQVL